MAHESSKGASLGSRVFKLEKDGVMALCESFATVRSLTVWLLLEYGEYDQLLDLEIDPYLYTNSDEFRSDYLVTRILSKCPRLPINVDREAVAVSKFRDAEELCRLTNQRIPKVLQDCHSDNLWELSLHSRVQLNIQRILGPYPTRKSLNWMEQKMRFGPGATTSLTSGIVTQGNKYKERYLECTESLLPFRTFSFPDLWKETARDIRVVDTSKMAVVPKNAKTDRVICIEPDLNIFVQLGTGALIRERLRSFGLDLSTQAWNQTLASMAFEWDLATVDLSAASDTISLTTVSTLLPPEWVRLLELSRTPCTTYKGERIELEKWSSMGNGYTFELETLIFYAVILSVVPEDEWFFCSAYGDDCILPERYMPDFTRALNFLGFKVNDEKTFGKGIFHESCGTDWFWGHEVRPIFLRSDLHDFQSICYLYANNVRRWSSSRNGGYFCDARCLPFWLRCFAATPKSDRHLIPDGVGDGGFITDFDRATPSRCRHLQSWRYRFRHIPSVERLVSSHGSYLSFLNGNRTDFSQGRESLRGRFRPAVNKIGTVLNWPSLGPWV